MNNTPIPQDRVVGLEASLSAKYVKPELGIPESDFAAAVSTSLGLADTSLQSASLLNRREYFPTIANGTDTEHDLDIGAARIWVSDGTSERLVFFASETVAIDGAGLDTGTVANSTWYYLWGFYNPTTDDSLYLLSASATAPAAPSGYTFKRFLCEQIAAAVLTDGSANIRNGKFSGKRFEFSANITDASATITTASSTLISVSVPQLSVYSISRFVLQATDVSGNNSVSLRHADTDNSIASVRCVQNNAFTSSFQVLVRAVSSQVRYAPINDSGTLTWALVTHGYEVF